MMRPHIIIIVSATIVLFVSRYVYFTYQRPVLISEKFRKRHPDKDFLTAVYPLSAYIWLIGAVIAGNLTAPELLPPFMWIAALYIYGLMIVYGTAEALTGVGVVLVIYSESSWRYFPVGRLAHYKFAYVVDKLVPSLGAARVMIAFCMLLAVYFL